MKSMHEINQHLIGHCTVQSCSKILILLKKNSFIHLAASFYKMLFFLKQNLKILSFFDHELKLKMLALFLSLKDNTEYMYILKQHLIGKHPMQSCPNRLI